MRDYKKEYEAYKHRALKNGHKSYAEWLEKELEDSKGITWVLGVAVLLFLLLSISMAIWPEGLV